MYTDIKRKIYQYATTWFYKRKMKNRALAVLFFIDPPALSAFVPLFPCFGSRKPTDREADEDDADDGGGKEIRINYRNILIVERHLSARRGISFVHVYRLYSMQADLQATGDLREAPYNKDLLTKFSTGETRKVR